MQDNYYLKKEADDFFTRWASTVDLENQPDIRQAKIDIFNKIQKVTEFENKRYSRLAVLLETSWHF